MDDDDKEYELLPHEDGEEDGEDSAFLFFFLRPSLFPFLTRANFGTSMDCLFFTCDGEGCTRRRRGAASLSEVIGDSLPSFSLEIVWDMEHRPGQVDEDYPHAY